MRKLVRLIVFGILLQVSCTQVKETEGPVVKDSILLNDSVFTKLSTQISGWDISIDSVQSKLNEIDTTAMSQEEKFRLSYLNALCLITAGNSTDGQALLQKMILRYTDKEHQPIIDELLAKTYNKSRNFERAIILFEKAATADSVLGNTQRFLKNRYNAIACLSNVGDNKHAISLGERMQSYCKLNHIEDWYIEFRFVLTTAYMHTGNYELALEISREYIQYLGSRGELTSESLIDLSHILEIFKLYDNAIDTLKVAKEICLNNGDSNNLASYYQNLGAMHLKKGNHVLAWAYRDTVNIIRDRIFMRARNAQYHELEMLNVDLNKELELSDLKYKTEADRVFKIWLSLVIALLLTVAVLSIGFFRNRLINQRKLQAEQAERFNAERQLIGVNASLETLEQERKRVAMDLHDGIGVLASTAKLRVSQVAKKIEEPEIREILSETNEVLTEISNDVKRIAHNIMPSSLSKLGLKYAIEELIEKAEKVSEIKFEYDLDEVEFDGEDTREIMLYRICQELLNNGLKYSQAKTISFKLKLINQQLKLTYDDDGIGIEDDNAYLAGNGFNTMKSRIEYLNGKVEFRSAKEHGTHFEFILPHEA